MLEDNNGQRVQSTGSAPHWRVFHLFLPHDQIAAPLRRAIVKYIDATVGAHQENRTTVINSSAAGNQILPGLSTNWYIECGEWLIATQSQDANLPIVQINQMFGMMLWHILATDRTTTWRVGKEGEQREYELFASERVPENKANATGGGFFDGVVRFLNAAFAWPTHCPHCKMEIRQGATACPHCTRNILP